VGRQSEPLEGAELWVVPNPSGLNAHETVDSLAGWYRRAGRAAGIVA
jgi:double-stranded uracil-DNA glycosylase